MNVNSIVKEIDKEIANLQKARAILLYPNAPEKPHAAVLGKSKKAPPTKKRNLAPEGRARIAAAVKKRWAKYHKALKA